MSDLKLPVDYRKLDWKTRKAVREQYVKKQGGLCWYCREPLNKSPSKEVYEASINWKLFPKNFLKYPIHIHHSHDTGITIGAVHSKCNAYLWEYKGE